jgi:hypothetical protein
MAQELLYCYGFTLSGGWQFKRQVLGQAIFNVLWDLEAIERLGHGYINYGEL